ncbi:hypothetical protein JET14_13250 [Martelella lutilitoris]|uniref:Uncharacterized protein n=1 Tax=Martelella lutilitoris TaxID=2583532 RepID=A0A7T7HHN5_9HYPH|nr:hypothetical protein [Martelella lutilitoris]QQM29293.1 hypothetical protein JET14_13250 [Martelella lutilitoris]
MAEKKIGGRTFKCEPLLATKALVLQGRLARALGPVAGKLPAILAARNGNDTQKAAADTETIAALVGIFEALTPEEYADLVKDIVEIAKLQRPSGDYEPVDLDGDFHGDMKSVFPVMFFVLQTQFQDFFGDALANGLRKTTGKG